MKKLLILTILIHNLYVLSTFSTAVPTSPRDYTQIQNLLGKPVRDDLKKQANFSTGNCFEPSELVAVKRSSGDTTYGIIETARYVITVDKNGSTKELSSDEIGKLPEIPKY